MKRFDERLKIPSWIGAIVLAGVLSSCNMAGTPDTTAPTVLQLAPSDGGTSATNEPVTATFDEAIDVTTLTTSTFALASGATTVAGSVSFDAATDMATYTPTLALAVGTTYTATLSTDITDVAGNPLEDPVTWDFTTEAIAATTDSVPLGSAGDFVLLSKAGISTTGVTFITGDIGVSPIDLTAITGFNETLDPSGEFATSTLVDGQHLRGEPRPTDAHADDRRDRRHGDRVHGRSRPHDARLDRVRCGEHRLEHDRSRPAHVEHGVAINTDLTLTGTATDVWILQIAQDLTVADGISVLLAGDALPENVFWQVAEQVTLGTGSELHGVVLSKTAVVMNTGATLTGRAFAQTEITLDATTVTQP
ncbi:MAG: ice-binding family protein [Trueperaceae bacterium]|nr:ice-binding family protein [Trueperaceae bacterium]